MFVTLINIVEKDKEVIMKSLSGFGSMGFSKCILIAGDESEKSIDMKNAQELKDVMSTFWPVHIMHLNRSDIYETIADFVKLIDHETDSESRVIINVSGASPLMTSISHVVSGICNTELVCGDENHLQNMPVGRFKMPTNTQYDMLVNVGDGAESITKLMNRYISWLDDLKVQKKQNTVLANVAKIVHNLEHSGYVTETQQSHTIKIVPTSIGKLLIRMYDYYRTCNDDNDKMIENFCSAEQSLLGVYEQNNDHNGCDRI